MLMNTAEYLSIIENIKSEITAAQYRAAVHVNADMLLLYYDIGCVINEHKSWGNKFIDNLAADIRIAFPESKGYSVRNLKYMAKFAEIYPDREFVQQVVAQIPWGHNIVLLDKVADMDERKWYILNFQKFFHSNVKIGAYLLQHSNLHYFTPVFVSKISIRNGNIASCSLTYD